jgi:hypothetical protein
LASQFDERAHPSRTGRQRLDRDLDWLANSNRPLDLNDASHDLDGGTAGCRGSCLFSRPLPTGR